MKILILFAHPAFERSRVHASLIRAVKQLPEITLRDLYEVYPDFDIHPEAEQKILAEHDVIIFQHPFYWYSGPALLKQWMDLVLEHGWAYGKNGTALKDKLLLQVISTGGTAHAYSPEGHHGHEISHFMTPFEQSARLCHMQYLPPFVVHGANVLDDNAMAAYTESYIRLLKSMQAGELDVSKAQRLPEINTLFLR